MLSAVRLWEHTQYRQINPFRQITRSTCRQPASYIDVITCKVKPAKLTGLTLHDLQEGRYGHLAPEDVSQLLRNSQGNETKLWILDIQAHLLDIADRKAVRNLPKPFLPSGSDGPLGVPGLLCALQSWLDAHRHEKADLDQWYNRLDKLSQRGVRTDELNSAHLENINDLPSEPSLSGAQILDCLDYSSCQISILPVIKETSMQLEFLPVTNKTPIKRLKPKLKKPAPTKPVYRDPVMGYWVDEILWDDLLSDEEGWLALSCRGEVLTSYRHPTGLCKSTDEAMNLASYHARQLFPKLTAQGRWSHYSVTGGEKYREWLVTLPFYPASYYNRHFPHRNILLHLRCDIREGANGERVLLLQEVQSDWIQALREARRGYGDSTIPNPPWEQEWQSLALKLMLMHAASLHVDALAWTTGEIQVRRYNGLGEDWLRRQYDEILPREATKLLRKHKVSTQAIEVFVPVNFTIRPAEIGYEVVDGEGEILGVAKTEGQVRSMLPDGAHEELMTMHGLRLNDTVRKAILLEGFHAWGHGIK